MIQGVEGRECEVWWWRSDKRDPNDPRPHKPNPEPDRGHVECDKAPLPHAPHRASFLDQSYSLNRTCISFGACALIYTYICERASVRAFARFRVFRVCVCVCACVRACVLACVRAYVCVRA